MTWQEMMKSLLELVTDKYNTLEGNQIIYLQDHDGYTGLKWVTQRELEFLGSTG
jgi:hypothetical protein